MAKGSPISNRNAAAGISTTQPGPILKMGAIANITTVATTGTLPTANGSVTIADAATPTVAELLEYCVELEAKLEALLSALRTSGALTA